MSTRTTVARAKAFGLLITVYAALAGCGGGSDVPEEAPTASPASPAPAAAAPAAPLASLYYFSDCQAGAETGCVAGNNANAGTSASAPKRDLTGFNVNALPAGAQLLFKRGGAWNWSPITIENRNAMPTAPIVFDAFGSGAAPLWRTASGTAVTFGEWANTVNDGGYIFRNLRLDGAGTGQWGFWLHDHVRNVTIENLDVGGFVIAIHSQNGVDHLTVRNSNLHHNRNHGMLGGGDNMLLEGNIVANNNMDGGPMEHGFYLSHGTNVVVRNNQFLRNSAPGGVCNGGNFTMHGQLDNWLIEGNRIQQDAASGGCYGLSITTGYSSAEWFRRFTVRGNTIINVGNCAICAGSAPGIVVENNTVVNLQATGQRGVQIPTGSPGSGDDADRDPVVRNNTMCFANTTSVGVVAEVAGAQVTNNTVLTGTDLSAVACLI